MKPWDLERMTTGQVRQRLDWILAQLKHNSTDGGDGDGIG